MYSFQPAQKQAQAEYARVPGYAEWFTRPKMVTHPGTNLA